MSNEQDYVLGTHDEEIERLGLQHRVWRSRMLAAWEQAGITQGSRVLDLGCGPGFAILDLAEIVGPQGAVVGVERSTRFIDFARSECRLRGHQNVRLVEADLTGSLELDRDFDAVWCRWVASFVPKLSPLIKHVAEALRPGGVAIFHEYVNYSSWRTIPPSLLMEKFVVEVMASWRASGGEPDIALTLLPELHAAGFEVLETKPIVFAVDPNDFAWHWPRSFVHSNLKRMVGMGRISEAWADEALQDFLRLERTPGALMLTPTLLQIVVRKR